MNKKIIVAPLNWGLGHASRCVPIIKLLIANHYIPVIASDGKALLLLQQEFPELEVLELPSYHIYYGRNLKWTLFKKVLAIQKTVRAEKELLENYLTSNRGVVGVISDNRFGMHSNKVPCVYLTHQLNVLSGIFTPFTSFLHRRIIRKFDECWIPDIKNSVLSGILSQSDKKLHQKYIGILSRFSKKEVRKKIEILVVLSGPEPNRSHIETKLIEVFNKSNKRVSFVRGIVQEQEKKEQLGNVTFYNFMTSEKLNESINAADLVICRSGYSSIMDLIALDKKAILIPTKGQNEQEYLARHVSKKAQFVSVSENAITAQLLETKIAPPIEGITTNLEPELLRLFERK